MRLADSLAVADFDGDGFADIVTGVTSGLSSSIRVLFGGTGGTFSRTATLEVEQGGAATRPILVSDFDLDGDSDIAVANRGASSLSLHVVAYPGDTSGNGRVNTNDAYRLAWLAAQSDLLVSS